MAAAIVAVFDVTFTALLFVIAAAVTLNPRMAFAFPEQGRWQFQLDQERMLAGVVKAVYEETMVQIEVLCNSDNKDARVSISYALRLMRCYQETIDPDDQDLLSKLHDRPDLFSSFPGETAYFVTYLKSQPQNHSCDHSIVLTPEESPFSTRVLSEDADENVGNVRNRTPAMRNRHSKHKSIVSPSSRHDQDGTSIISDAGGGRRRRATILRESETTTASSVRIHYGSQPQVVIHEEGIFVVTVKVEPLNPGENFTALVELEIRGARGYLSAVDWPLLPFYGSMSIVYLVYGLAWLTVLGLQWRDLLRIQFWIGGVIFLGMVEKAVFYLEYQSVNSTGNSVRGAVLFAELVSCVKRTLARMLVIIVSLGFGIVKPRLGAMLHRVVGVGALYGLLCSLEAYLRVMRPRKDVDPARTLVLAEVPLAILDTAICWWIFSNLVQTTRTLRLRRNVVKLALYRHFTNALIFACIASVAFMVWVYKAHNLPNCVAGWNELWLDEAYWHLLFSVILLVIMFLWRPTNNNQRYAFMPLIDAADEEDDIVTNDAFDGMKMRSFKGPSVPLDREAAKRAKVEDDLSWVEENIPSSLADSALPLLDSDEEIMNTKFEMSKME